MHCMTSRVGELGYNFCVAEIHGRAVNVQVGDVVSPDTADPPRTSSNAPAHLQAMLSTP